MIQLRPKPRSRNRSIHRAKWIGKNRAFHQLRAHVLIEARASVRRFLSATMDVKVLVNWISGTEQDIDPARLDPSALATTDPRKLKAAIPFVDVCRENHLDPDLTAQKLLADIPPELMKIVENF